MLDQAARGEWACGKGQSLGVHQRMVFEYAKMLASKPRDQMKRGDPRGLVVWHNTGAGKTVTAMGIIAAFWKTGRPIYFVTTVANAKGNSAAEYAANAVLFYPEYAKMIFGELPNLTAEQLRDSKNPALKEWAKKNADTLRKPPIRNAAPETIATSFWVFGGSGNHIQKAIQDGAVIIMDEAQNIFKPKSQGNETAALIKIQQALPQMKTINNTILFVLTATPGDTAPQFVEMMNAVRPYDTEPFTVQQFVQNPSIARGLVSYADVRGDRSKYGTLLKGVEDLKIPHDPAYFAALANDFLKASEERDLDRRPDQSAKFFLKSRIAGCMLPASKVKGFLSNEQLDASENETNPPAMAQVGASKQFFSNKTRAALRNLHKLPGCQYMYVPNINVLKAVVAALEQMKYQRVSLALENGDVEVVDRDKKGKDIYGVTKKIKTTKAPRFIAYHDGDINGESKNLAALNGAMDFFKSSVNKRGEYIKLVIGTAYEGLDMRWLQAVHLLAPLPTMSDNDQAVGRALRFCGHDEAAKRVRVLRYYGTPPANAKDIVSQLDLKPAKLKALEAGMGALEKRVHPDGVNVHIVQDALRRGKPFEEFQMCARGQALECGNSGYLLDALQYGRKTQCNIPCKVQLDKNGNVVIPPPPNYQYMPRSSSGMSQHISAGQSTRPSQKSSSGSRPMSFSPSRTGNTSSRPSFTGLAFPGGSQPSNVTAATAGLQRSGRPSPRVGPSSGRKPGFFARLFGRSRSANAILATPYTPYKPVYGIESRSASSSLGPQVVSSQRPSSEKPQSSMVRPERRSSVGYKPLFGISSESSRQSQRLPEKRKSLYVSTPSPPSQRPYQPGLYRPVDWSKYQRKKK